MRIEEFSSNPFIDVPPGVWRVNAFLPSTCTSSTWGLINAGNTLSLPKVVLGNVSSRKKLIVVFCRHFEDVCISYTLGHVHSYIQAQLIQLMVHASKSLNRFFCFLSWVLQRTRPYSHLYIYIYIHTSSTGCKCE